MLAAETAWREQAHQRLRITRGSCQSAPPLSYATLWDSSHRHLGESQRETLSKTNRGSGKLWPAPTERDFGLLGEGKRMENRPFQTLVLQ